jgi:hypothetical protein
MIRRIILKVIGLVAAWLFLLAVGLGFMSLALWMLVPAAFPLLDFTYWQALALTGIVVLFGLPVAVKN